MRYLTLFPILIIFLYSSFVSAQVPVLQCDHPDYIGLEAFYNATNGENWKRADGWMTTCSPCEWYGIRCDENDRVTVIALPENDLTGELPEQIGTIEFLSTLSAPGNALTGSLPQSLYRLDIWDLYLSDNFLTGTLSENVAALKNLRFLRLQNNDLSGDLPQGLSNLRNLRRLNLEGNNFGGEMPAGVADLPRLDIIDIRDNNLSGCLPDDVLSRCSDNGIRFSGNPGLPFSGDLASFCSEDLVASDQIGAPCDDGNPLTSNDEITGDCGCGTASDELQIEDTQGINVDQIGLSAPEESNATPSVNGLQVPATNVQAIFEEVSVFPNPFSGTELRINLPGNTGNAGLRVYAMAGSTVVAQVVTGEVASLPVPQLSPGFYLVEVIIEGQRTVRKLVVE